MKNIFKIVSLLAAAVMLFACEKEDQSGLMIVSDKDVIQSNGEDLATLKVMFKGKDVTSEAEIYIEEGDEDIPVGTNFTATKDGEYKFWAQYGAYSTYNSAMDDKNLFVIKAISVKVPSALSDSQPSKTSFVHRAFLTQYTGLACGYCPYMIRILNDVKGKGTIPSKAVLAAVHSYSNADPAYIATPRVSNYPYLEIDMVQGFSHSQPTSVLESLIENHVASSAKAGIAVNPVYYEKEKLLVVRVSVKAADSGLYNVGAWLLEDGITGAQNDYDGIKKQDPEHDYDTHDNCVRIADSKYKGTHFGYLLGEMKAGDVLHKTFVMQIKNKWELDNLHLAVFASHGVAKGSKVTYTVCNAVDVPIDAPTPFEYK